MENSEHCGYLDSHGMSRIQDDLNQRSGKDRSQHGSTDMLRAALAQQRQINVGIVGAGFAGLRCADVLLRYGIKVTIIEARNRLGGRVAQSTHLGHPVDLYVVTNI
jgi:heterodisulfide reductase subunit A-like polyferredoxin